MYAKSFLALDGNGRLTGARTAQAAPYAHYTCHLCGSALRYSIYPDQDRRYGLYFPSATGTAVTQLVHVKFLPSRLLPSPVHTNSLHRRYKIYNVNWD